jgi:hypothetical protein
MPLKNEDFPHVTWRDLTKFENYPIRLQIFINMSVDNTTHRLSDAIYYAHQYALINKPSQSSLAPDDKSHSTLSRAKTITIPDEALPGIIIGDIELPILPARSNIPRPNITTTRTYLRTHSESIKVQIKWSRRYINVMGTALVTSVDEAIGNGDRIYCEKMYGNGRVIEVIRYHGRYTCFLAEFVNDEGSILTRSLVIPSSFFRHTPWRRCRALISQMIQPWVHYTACNP